jgi:hypothetical protein
MFNADRVNQATSLRTRLVADGQGSNEHRVLQVLAARMAYMTGPKPLTIVDTCFPSIETIVEESLLSDRSVRYALDNLIAKGYITKSKISGRHLRGRKDQNKYENNRYHLVPEVWDSVGHLWDKKSDVTASHGPDDDMEIDFSTPGNTGDAGELAQHLYTKLGSPEKWAPTDKQWLGIFGDLLRSHHKSDLVEMIDYATGKDYWIGQLTRDAVNPAKEFQSRANTIRKQAKDPYKSSHKSTPTPTPAEFAGHNFGS